MTTGRVPLMAPVRENRQVRDELDEAWDRVVDSGQYILGREVEAFESEVADHLDVEHAVGVASGTDALWLSLRALGVGRGDRVLTTPFTFFATVSAIRNTGARPCFADVDPETCNLDPDEVETVVEDEDVDAILPVHLYGRPCPMDALVDIATDHGIPLVEDAAQAFAAEIDGRKVGTSGEFGAFSFFPTKNLGGLGDGGLVATDDPDLAEDVRRIRAHGGLDKHTHRVVGVNSRLDTLQAALLRVKLPRVGKWIEMRRRIAGRYDEGFAPIDGIATPPRHPGHAYNLYTIQLDDPSDRDDLTTFLDDRGIDTGVYYPRPVHLQPALDDLNHQEGDFPAAERVSRRVVSLPMSARMSDEEIERVVQSVTKYFQERNAG